MFVPLSTDAPVYYYPRGTIGLITLNVLAFLLTKGGAEEYIEIYGLSHGAGLHPLQWITSNFIHYGYFHLLGNLLALWGFGLVVEGKIGTLPYLGLYLGIGALQCAFEQLVFSAPAAPSFGASAIIYGLIAIALIWAPSNEVTVFYWILFRVGMFDVSIFWYSIITLLYSTIIMLLIGARLSSEILHLMGAVIGSGVGFSMLLSGTVDCEGWDLISVIRGTTPTSDRFVQREGARTFGQPRLKRKLKRSRDQLPAAVPLDQPLSAGSKPERFEQLIQSDKPQAALLELRHLQKTRPDWSPNPEHLRTLARGLRKRREFESSLEINLQYLKQIDYVDPDAVFDAAEILILVQSRPQAARKLLARLDKNRLSENQQHRFRKIDREALKVIDTGVLEIEADL